MVTGAKISDEGRSIPQKPPLVIYSNTKLNIDIDGEVFMFSNNDNVKYPQQRFTRLDSIQIATLVARGSWDDIRRQMTVNDYLQYVIIMVEAIMAPITIMTAIYTCLRTRCCKKTTMADVEASGQQLGGMPLRARNRRSNFDRNRALLSLN